MATPQADISSLPNLTEDDVRKLTDPKSFSRGERYHRSGMIYHTVRRGDTLAASCHGSSGGPYDVRVTLAAPGRVKIASWSCTCPLGIFCKHLVALTLTWIAIPESFEVKPSVDELLASQDRAGLIAIIQRFIARDPTLENMLDNIVPAAPLEIAPAKPGDAAKVTLDIARIRSRLDDALDKNRDVYSISNEWDEDYNGYANEAIAIERVESVFDEVVEIGERYEQAGRFADATAVYALVGVVGTERFDDTFENDTVFNLIFDAGRGLVRCLERQATLPDRDRLPPQLRSQLIDTIYEIWCFAGHGQWGDDSTGVPDSDEEVAELAESEPDVASVVAANLTDDERRQLEDHWRSQAADAGNPDWRRRSAIAFGSAFSGPDGLQRRRSARIDHRRGALVGSGDISARPGKARRGDRGGDA